MRSILERVDTGADFVAAVDRWKRLRRQGWRLTVLQELESGDVLALGYFDPDAELEPDRAGQLELDVEVFANCAGADLRPVRPRV